MPKNVKVIGLTGGIGSGKSYISNILKQMGYPVYDCDSNAKALMNNNEQLKTSLKQLLGDEVYSDGVLNRVAMANKIFNDASLVERVNGLVHPTVKTDIIQWVESQSDATLLFVESAIVLESGFAQWLDGFIAVIAPDAVRIERAMKRDHATAEQVAHRIKYQTTNAQLSAATPYIIHNDGQQPLLPQIERLLEWFQ